MTYLLIKDRQAVGDGLICGIADAVRNNVQLHALQDIVT